MLGYFQSSVGPKRNEPRLLGYNLTYAGWFKQSLGEIPYKLFLGKYNPAAAFVPFLSNVELNITQDFIYSPPSLYIHFCTLTNIITVVLFHSFNSHIISLEIVLIIV